MSPRIVEGNVVVPKGARFGVVASRFNHFIVDHLVGGALDALVRHGAEEANITVVRVPGAWEIPVAVQRLARGAGDAGAKKKPAKLDAIIALAAVIRGSTPHFDYVAGEVSKGVAAISLEAGLPISFGVLTTDTIEQAIERAGTKAGNKGWDAAVSAIEMVSLDRALAGAGF
ncbi:MAG: 6,7-dimethyl-8-ribityllumazine synthase [Labilithrix sp.]|nr:6,7-dimethyl-8-ribityllumazine synthase [Labilithrix sp.]MCW5837244.1 6,7-dimethyl-8-ribityllumazine synthase [Labilithrix sp.]